MTTQFDKDLPTDTFLCWAVSEEEKIRVKQNGGSYGNYSTNEYFKLINRIDNNIIEGYIGRTDRELSYLNDRRDRLSYLIDFDNRKKTYFTFDHINLYELVEMFQNNPNPIRFILKRIDNFKIAKPNQAFMIMPFHDQTLNAFYTANIKPFLFNESMITIYRADDFYNNDVIIDTIYKLIDESEFIIADTTLENKNSFYELGYASAMNKEIITIQNKGIEQKLFFDRAHIRSIFYDPEDTSSFQFELKSTIQSIRSKT